MNVTASRTRPKKVGPGLILSIFFSLFAAFLLAYPCLAQAAKAIDTEVTVGKSSILTVPVPISRVSITDPEIADVLVLSPNEVQINGKKVGTTSLIIWDKTGAKTFFDITVVVELDALRLKIAETAPGDDLKLQMLNANTLVVTGTVTTDERKVKIRNLLLGFGKDITEEDLYVLQGGVVKQTRAGGGGEGKGLSFVMLVDVLSPQQVLLQITVASIDRNASRNLGINWAYMGKNINLLSSITAGLPVNTINNLISGSRLGTDTLQFGNSPNFGVVNWGNGLAIMLRLLSEKGLAKVLAEPNLIVKSGESGSFLAGGEFPIPIVTTAAAATTSAVTVVYKEFGVRMNFSPFVRESGLIELGMGRPALTAGPATTIGGVTTGAESGIEVSSLDIANAVTLSGFSIPALKKDAISTSVVLREGESFVVAGLLRDDWSKNLAKVPLLGDIPILGAFFREQAMKKTERELVFIVTPKIVRPMAPGQRAVLPGENEPSAKQEEDLRWIPLLPTYRSNDAEQVK